MQFIRELRDGENVSAIYLCKNKTTAKNKSDKTYYNLLLQDRTGTADGKVWDLSSGIDHFESGDYIHVDGQAKLYNNQMQIIIRRIRKAWVGDYTPEDYLPASPYRIEDMKNAVLELISRVENPHLHALLSAFFIEDSDFMDKFSRRSAARSIHHAFVGGLLQHSLFVARTCEFLCRQYKQIDHDLLVTAALLHDIGKVWELSDFPDNDYTDAGQLLGHIVIGAMRIREKCAGIPGFPENLREELLHCILSHHGELEYGSPKKPALIEAVALSFADNIDAKMEHFTEILSSSEGINGWLGFDKIMDSNIRRTVL